MALLADSCLAGVLAGLGLYLYFVELPEQHTELVSATQAKQILPFEQAQITALTGPQPFREVVLSQTPGHPWGITAPDSNRRRSTPGQALVRALVTGKVSRLVKTHPVSLTPFGLDHPSTVVTVTAGIATKRSRSETPAPLPTLYVLRRRTRLCS